MRASYQKEVRVPIDGKYGRVTLEHGEHIPDDEPVIVFRASDALLCPVLSNYHVLATQAGSPQRHLDLIEETYNTIADWQEAHPDQVKTPTSETSRAWLDH